MAVLFQVLTVFLELCLIPHKTREQREKGRGERKRGKRERRIMQFDLEKCKYDVFIVHTHLQICWSLDHVYHH